MENKDYEKIGYLHDNFKMFHIKDNEEKEFSYHYHDFMKIILFLSGDVSYFIEGRDYKLAPYDVVLVDAGEIHKPVIHSSCTYERIIFYISSDYISSLKTDDYDLATCFYQAKKEHTHVLRISANHKTRLYRVLQELANLDENDFASKLLSQTLFIEFLIQLNRSSLRGDLSYLETGCSNEKVFEVLQYIHDHVTEPLSIDSLADKFYISRYYLMHAFKEETGYTLGNYVTTKRLFLARELIQNGMPITQACYASGFQNYSTFSRAYKKMFQSVPRQLKD